MIRELSTGVKSIDDFLEGGVPIGSPSLVFGIQDVGKSIFSLQLAFSCNAILHKPVLYIDTENMWFSKRYPNKGYTLWSKRLKDRFDLKKIEIDFVNKTDIFKLGKYFGMEYQIRTSENRVSVMVKFPRRNPMAGSHTKETLQINDWLERSTCWKALEEKDYGLLILDSITRPIKDFIGKSTQNLPGRGSALDPLLSAMVNIAVEKNMVVLVTDHCTKSPMDRHPYGIPWGGADIKYYIKNIFAIYMPLKSMKEKYGKLIETGLEARIFERHRFPGLVSDMITIVLKKDYGYIDPPVVDYTKGGKIEKKKRK